MLEQKIFCFLLNIGFEKSAADSCVYSGVFLSKKVLLIVLYIDYALLFSQNENILIEIINE